MSNHSCRYMALKVTRGQATIIANVTVFLSTLSPDRNLKEPLMAKPTSKNHLKKLEIVRISSKTRRDPIMTACQAQNQEKTTSFKDEDFPSKTRVWEDDNNNNNNGNNDKNKEKGKNK